MKEIPLTEKNRVQTEINELSTFILDANGLEVKDHNVSLDLEKAILTITEKE